MSRHGELGAALSRWRERAVADGAPGALPGEGPGPGLRREELAESAGLSVDYITRLEEGRATSPSSQVLASLARALRLSDLERRHLFLLAGHSPPATEAVSDRIPPGVRRLLDRLSPTPVAVYDAAWNLVTWNPVWAVLLGQPSEVRGARSRNAAWLHFSGRPSRFVYTAEQESRLETALVADLRAATLRYPTDAGLRFLISELRRVSGRFVQLWNSRIAGVHESDTTTVLHPDAGPLAVDCDVLTVPGSDLRITVLSAAPGSPAEATLHLLGGIGSVGDQVVPA